MPNLAATNSTEPHLIITVPDITQPKPQSITVPHLNSPRHTPPSLSVPRIYHT